MDIKIKAKLLLIEIKAVQEFSGDTRGLLTLVNEVFRDAKTIAEIIVDKDEDKKAA